MGTSWMFLYEAYHQIGVSFASLLYYCGPVFVRILSPLIFKEKLALPKVVGFVIVFVGIILINGTIINDNGNYWGVICGILSAATYFFMVTFNKKSTNVTGMENSVIQLVVSFITVSLFVVIKQGLIINIPANAWIWVIILGIVNTGFGCYLYFSSLAKLPAQTVAVCSYLELFSAVIFARFLLGDEMSILQIIGAVCIIGGAMIGELVKSKKIKGD